MENTYSYYITVTDPKYYGIANPPIISSLIKDQTKLINPITVIDKLPGNKSYVKRQNGNFEELTQIDSYYLRQLNMNIGTYYGINMRYVFINDIKNYNPIKVKNGEIIFNGATNHKTYLYPISKCTYDASLYDKLQSNNLIDLDYVGVYHYKNNPHLGPFFKENFKHTIERFFFYVNLPKGYYIYSHGQNIHMNNESFIPYVFEVVDDPFEEHTGD